MIEISSRMDEMLEYYSSGYSFTGFSLGKNDWQNSSGLWLCVYNYERAECVPRTGQNLCVPSYAVF